MTEPETRVEILSKEESRQLLQDKSHVGRVGFLDDARLTMLPVNSLVNGTAEKVTDAAELDRLRRGWAVAASQHDLSSG